MHGITVQRDRAQKVRDPLLKCTSLEVYFSRNQRAGYAEGGDGFSVPSTIFLAASVEVRMDCAFVVLVAHCADMWSHAQPGWTRMGESIHFVQEEVRWPAHLFGFHFS